MIRGARKYEAGACLSPSTCVHSSGGQPEQQPKSSLRKGMSEGSILSRSACERASGLAYETRPLSSGSCSCMVHTCVSSALSLHAFPEARTLSCRLRSSRTRCGAAGSFPAPPPRVRYNGVAIQACVYKRRRAGLVSINLRTLTKVWAGIQPSRRAGRRTKRRAPR